MALLNLDHDPWLAEHTSCERLHQTISEQLHLRSSEARASENYARLSASIRIRLKQFEAEVNELKRKLEISNASKPVTSQEYERRQRLVENLKSKHIQLVQRFNDRTKLTSSLSQDRSSLLSSQIVADGGTTGWGMDDDDDDDRPSRPLLPQSSDWSVERLREQQKRMIENQNEGLENLSRVISRQKEIAVSINCEVDFHNEPLSNPRFRSLVRFSVLFLPDTYEEVIDDIAVKMDRTSELAKRETTQIGVIMRKDSTWGYWLIILVLFLAIMLVALY